MRTIEEQEESAQEFAGGGRGKKKEGEKKKKRDGDGEDLDGWEKRQAKRNPPALQDNNWKCSDLDPLQQCLIIIIFGHPGVFFPAC